jgi:hypothetical protein
MFPKYWFFIFRIVLVNCGPRLWYLLELSVISYRVHALFHLLVILSSFPILRASSIDTL